MWKNLPLCEVLLVIVLILPKGNTKAAGQFPGLTQDDANAVDLLQEQCVNGTIIGCLSAPVQPHPNELTTNILTKSTGEPFSSATPSATALSTTDTTIPILFRERRSEIMEKRRNSRACGKPSTSIKTSATIQPTNTTYTGLYLYKASARGDLESVNMALAAGTNVNWGNPNKDRATPLHAAAQFNHPAIVNALLNAGADKDNRNEECETPLFIASYKGSTDAVTVLIASGASIDIPHMHGFTALHSAARRNHPAIVIALLEAGAEERDIHGMTPLYHASIKGSIDVVNALIAHGTDVNILDNDGSSPVSTASLMGHLNVVKALIAANADVNISDNNGWTALSSASGLGYLGIVKALLAANADPNIQGTFYFTALHGAAKLHNQKIYRKIARKIARALLRNGADTTIQNERGETATQATRYRRMANLINRFAETTGK